MADADITLQAHCKLMLHAAKYPHAPVNGVLLAEDPKNKDVKSVKYVDCIPLFHVSLGLAPMTEIALLQIDTYCKSQGLVIAGYYQANENYNDNELNHVAKTLGRKIQENFHDAIVLIIDNRQVRADTVGQTYKMFTFKEPNWQAVDKKGRSEDEISKEECLYALLKSSAQRELIDFDNHLDNVSNDWRNIELNNLIARCT